MPRSTDKYARIERERRFLLREVPANAGEGRRIVDRYIDGTRLRLRRVEWPGSEIEYKLTQKIPAEQAGPVQGRITNTYLSAAEYEALRCLPAALLTKERRSAAPLGVDVFHHPLDGLILGEAEFDDDESMLAFEPPDYAVAEVTTDPRFTGGALVHAGRAELLDWLGDYGI